MYCRGCGEQLVDETGFCHKCGRPATDTPAASGTPRAPALNVNSPPSPAAPPPLPQPKPAAWNRNTDTSRPRLPVTRMPEARSGFTAFNEGPKDDREIDVVLRRQQLAAGQSRVGPLHDEIQPKAKKHG